MDISIIDKEGQELLEYINDSILLRKSGEISKVYSEFKLDLKGKDYVGIIIAVYDVIYKSIPFPLNLLDCGILYKTIGKIILNKVTTDIIEDIYVYKGLNIKVNDVIINFRGSNWTIVDTLDTNLREGLNLDVHMDEPTYKYFNWVLDLINKVDLDNLEVMFYTKYFNNIYNAVDKDIDSMYDMLLNIMLFNRDMIDDIKTLNTGEFLDLNDLNKGNVSRLELVRLGYKKIKNDIMLVYDGDKLKKIAKQVPVFKFKCYKDNIEVDVKSRYGNLFRLLDYKRVLDNGDLSEDFSSFSGVYGSDKLVYHIDDKLYIENLTTNKVKLLGTNLDILGYVVNEYGIHLYIRNGLGCIGDKTKGKVYKLNLLEPDVKLEYYGLIYDRIKG